MKREQLVKQEENQSVWCVKPMRKVSRRRERSAESEGELATGFGHVKVVKNLGKSHFVGEAGNENQIG